MELFPFKITDILITAFIFLRVGGILFFLPIFGDQPTPIKVRILLAGGITAAFYHLVPNTLDPMIATDVYLLGVTVIRELFIGFALGFVARIAFDGILMAAGLVGYQMGFGMANLLVPDAGQQMNAFTAFHRIVVILIFFSLDLHHIFINGVSASFKMIGVGEALPHSDLGIMLISLTADIFYIAIQIAAPVLVALLFTMAALGLVARTVPQMNVFTLSFPASFFVGLLVYIASFPFFPEWLDSHFETYGNHLIMTVKGLKP